MAELWLPLEDRLATWDTAAERLRVTGWRPGPAGVSAVELTPGLWVVVDHASPTTLTELLLDVVDGTVDGRQFSLLSALLGDEAAETLPRLLRRPPSSRPTPLRSARRRRVSPEDDPYWGDDGSRHQAFARLALAADLTGDAGVTPAARGVAAVEAALAAVDLDAPETHRYAQEAVDLLARSEAQFDDLKDRYRVSALVRSLADTLGIGPLAAQTRSIADDLIRFDSTAAFPAAALPMASAMAPFSDVESAGALGGRAAPSGRHVRAERPVEVDGEHAGWAWLDAGDNVRVKAGPAATSTWARVFRAPDRLLLGLAPLRRSDVDGRELVATLVIPPTASGDLVVDITGDPSAPRRAPSHEEHRRAVLLGREAARLTRLGDDRADAAWERCALAWEALGDVQRANLARIHGARDSRMPSQRRPPDRPPQLMADEID